VQHFFPALSISDMSTPRIGSKPHVGPAVAWRRSPVAALRQDIFQRLPAVVMIHRVEIDPSKSASSSLASISSRTRRPSPPGTGGVERGRVVDRGVLSPARHNRYPGGQEPVAEPPQASATGSPIHPAAYVRRAFWRWVGWNDAASPCKNTETCNSRHHLSPLISSHASCSFAGSSRVLFPHPAFSRTSQ